MTKYQIACKRGQRPSEHLFTIRSLIAYYKKQRKSLILSNLDIMKFYDSEHLLDVLSEAYNSALRGKLYRLIFEMNKSSMIKVKTPVGLSHSDSIDLILAQGSGEAGVLSSVNLDSGRRDVTLVNQEGDNQVK